MERLAVDQRAVEIEQDSLDLVGSRFQLLVYRSSHGTAARVTLTMMTGHARSVHAVRPLSMATSSDMNDGQPCTASRHSRALPPRRSGRT